MAAPCISTEESSPAVVPASNRGFPTYLPAGEHVGEPSPVDQQVWMVQGYVLLVEQIRLHLVNKITWMLPEGEANCRVVDLIGDPGLLCAGECVVWIV